MKQINLVEPKSKKLRLIQYLVKNGARVFRRHELEEKIRNYLQISYQAFGVLLHDLCQEGWIIQLKKSVYMVANTVTPVYEQEIAMVLVNGPTMVSHSSAFRYHKLTDQVSNKIQITTTNSVFVPQTSSSSKKATIKIKGTVYEFIRIDKSKFFGAEDAWIGDGSFKVTDLERTLLDGLSHPQYCGGWLEVLYAYKENFKRVNLDKIIAYALKLDIAVSRRLGWILDNCLDVNLERINCLARKDRKGYRLLDPSRTGIGGYDNKWKVRLNHNMGCEK